MCCGCKDGDVLLWHPTLSACGECLGRRCGDQGWARRLARRCNDCCNWYLTVRFDDRRNHRRHVIDWQEHHGHSHQEHFSDHGPHPVCRRCGGGAAVCCIPAQWYASRPAQLRVRLSCTTSRSRRRLMSLCVSKALSLFTIPSTRHDVQPRACAIHDALIVPLFAVIYRLNPTHHAYKGYIETQPSRPVSEKMLGLCQEVADTQNRLCAVLSKYATLLHETRHLPRRLSDLYMMLRLPRTSMAEKPLPFHQLSYRYDSGAERGHESSFCNPEDQELGLAPRGYDCY